MRVQNCFSLIFAAILITAELGAVAPYQYGKLPSGASDADVASAYSTWHSRRLKTLTNCNGQSAKYVDNGGSVYSEGQAYGLLMAANLDASSSVNFAQLWRYYKSHLDGNGLMEWNPGYNCTYGGGNAAADADLDAAAALITAARRWPGEGWDTEAQTMLNSIYDHLIDSCDGIKNGDTWGGCSDTGSKAYNPSYFRLGYLRTYACFDSDGSHDWSAVLDRSYYVLDYSYNNYALPPDWVKADRTYGAATNSAGYGYDSCRSPWSFTQDYLWWNDARASRWANKIAGVFTSKNANPGLAADDVGDDYNYSSGAKASNNHQPEFIGSAAIAMMSTATAQTYLDAFYDELVATDKNSYYSDSLKVIYLMILTGNFQEPCTGGGPTTPTYTPTITRTFTASPTPTPAFSLNKSASVSTASAGTEFEYYLRYENLSSGPDSTGVTAGVTLQHHNGGASGSAGRKVANFQIRNNSGGTINLQNYRLRYFIYGTGSMNNASNYQAWNYYDASGVATTAFSSYPTYYNGGVGANVEFRITWGSATIANNNSMDWQGAYGNDSYADAYADDWSYPGSVSGYTEAAAANIVLEQ